MNLLQADRGCPRGWALEETTVRTTNLPTATPENSSRNSKSHIAVKSEVFNFVAPGSSNTSTSTDELGGAP